MAIRNSPAHMYDLLQPEIYLSLYIYIIYIMIKHYNHEQRGQFHWWFRI